jgi:hypothetical protein
MAKKQPRMAAAPQLRKMAKASLRIDGESLAWRFSSSDKGGTWAWTNLNQPEEHKRVIERLHEFEKKNWDEIIKTGSHPIPVGGLTPPARVRLTEIEQDDIDELFSLRVNGVNRVWCIRDCNIMKVLWWDLDHEVCPSEKRHT